MSDRATMWFESSDSEAARCFKVWSILFDFFVLFLGSRMKRKRKRSPLQQAKELHARVKTLRGKSALVEVRQGAALGL